MTIKFLKNNTTYTASFPQIITRCKNETLDSIQARINHLPSRPNIKIKDRVQVSCDIGIYYMVVSQYTITMESLNGTYQVELQLCSETKELEGIICPELSITPNSLNRTVYDYLVIYNNEYGKKIRVGTKASYTWENKWTYSANCATKFNIPAPEMQWSMPTFRELITDLMQTCDCIPILVDNVIDFIDLTETGQEIINRNYLRWSNDLSGYASDLKMNLQNVLQTRENGITNSVFTVEMIPITSDEYTITSDNFVLKTKYPILNIKSLKLVGYVAGNVYGVNPILKIKDFTNIDGYSLICEKKEYETKELLRTTGAYDSTKTGAYYSQYQNYCAYFNRNSNIISGLTNQSKELGLFSYTNQTIDWWKYILYENDDDALFDMDWYSTFFIVEYETSTNQLLTVSKDEKVNNHEIMDNQTNAWVDAYSQGNLEKQKANRVGNEIVLLNQRLEPSNYLLKAELGDYIYDGEDKLICYQVEYQLYDKHMEVNAMLTKDYILRESFTGINSKIRTWKNAQDEAFEKHLISKKYCEFSFNNGSDEVVGSALSPLTETAITPVKYADVFFTTSDNAHYGSFMTDIISRCFGTSFVLSTGMSDNATAGKIIDLGYNDLYVNDINGWSTIKILNSSLIQSKGVPLKNSKYVDSNYENVYSSVSFYSLFNISQVSIENNTEITTAQLQSLYANVFSYPKLTPSSAITIGGATFNNLKDNKEIPIFNVQYEYVSAENDIYVTHYFVKKHKFIRTVANVLPDCAIVSYYKGKADQQRTANNSITYSVSGNEITISNIPTLASNQAISIGKNNQNWLVVRPPSGATAVTIYLNVLKDRDTSIYNASKEVVGDLYDN